MEHLTAIFEQLLSMAWTALPVMAVVLLTRFLLKRVPKKYTYLLWLVVAFRLVCPAAPESPVGLIRAEEARQQVAEFADDYVGDTWVIHDTSPYYDGAVAAGREPVSTGDGHSYVVAAADQLGEPDTVGNTWLPVLSILWLLGMAAMAAYLVLSTLRLRQQMSTAVRREGNVWECGGIPTPFVLGLFRPRIYIPFRMSEQERSYILAHERYHIRRGDHWAKLLGLAILTVYWWDPAVWLCWVLFCRDMEMRCDEAVLAELGDGVKREYSLSLVSFALDRRAPMALAFGEHDAAQRVKHVLRWKKAKPAAVCLAVAAVVVVAVVCGTNAGQRGSLVELRADQSGSLEFEVRAAEDIHSWALREDIYDDGKLISSVNRAFDGFDDENVGATPRKFTGKLWAELLDDPAGGLAGELTLCFSQGSNAQTEISVALPRDHYTGMAMVPGEETACRLEPGGEVLLCSYLLTTRADRVVNVSSEEAPLTQLNDTVVQYSLLLSGGPYTELEQRPLDLAQTLFDLRVTSREDDDGIRALVTAMGADRFGAYSIVRYEQAVGLHFETPPGDQQEAESELWTMAQLLLALIGDADQIDYSFPAADGGQQRTYYCDRGQPDAWAGTLGYADIKDLGRSEEGVRALMEYLGWNSGAASAEQLFQQARTLDAMSLTEVLLKTVLWGESLTGGQVSWPGNFGPSIQFAEAPADPEALDIAMARRTVLLMRMRPEEVFYVCWSYPDQQGNTLRREFYQDEADMIVSLSSHSRVHQQPETAEDLKLLIQFLGSLDETLFLRYGEEGNAFSPELGAEADAVWFAPEDIHDIEYAVLEWHDGQRFYPLTEEGYEYIEARLGTAKQTGDTACPFHSVLYLHRADGVVGKVLPAEDSCDVFLSDGRYYQFGDRAQAPYYDDNSALYGHFGTSTAELPRYTSETAVAPPEGSIPFTDILGYDGYIVKESMGSFWNMWTYYAVKNGVEFPIAENFGFFDTPQVYSVDLDGDGVKEFISNVQFGGDGHEDVYVYQRRGDEIWKGTLDLSGLPNFDNWGANATAAQYDPEADVFRVRYAQKGTEEPGVLEFRGLDWFVFAKYGPAA